VVFFTINKLYGGEGGITSGFLPFALRAALRTFNIAPGNFVEPLRGFSPILSCELKKI
jgi:hypothetical protein